MYLQSCPALLAPTEYLLYGQSLVFWAPSVDSPFWLYTLPSSWISPLFPLLCFYDLHLHYLHSFLSFFLSQFLGVEISPSSELAGFLYCFGGLCTSSQDLTRLSLNLLAKRDTHSTVSTAILVEASNSVHCFQCNRLEFNTISLGHRWIHTATG